MRKTLAERHDIPAWWKDGPAVHVCEVRTYDNTRTCTGSYYPQLPEHLRTFRDKIDGPIVAMLAGWENHRRWTGGDYFPVFDADQATAGDPAAAAGRFPAVLLPVGLVLHVFGTRAATAARFPRRSSTLASYVVDEKSGKPKEYVLNESNPAGDWKRHSYQFCVSPPQTKAFFCGVIDQAHALGVDVLQMDQTVSGAGDACYCDDARPCAGRGAVPEPRLLGIAGCHAPHGKSRSPDFVLFHEEPHEQLIPHLDGFHVREYYEKRWYRGYPGAMGIPLFSYLYHEYALGYGGDSAGLSKDNDRWHVRCHAMNLVAGRTPGVAIWSSHQSMFEAHPDQIAMIRNHCRLLKTRAKEFLMLGTMLHPYELAVPQAGDRHPGPARRQVGPRRPAHAGDPDQFLAVAGREDRPSVCQHLRNGAAAAGEPRHAERARREVLRRGNLPLDAGRSVPAAVAEPTGTAASSPPTWNRWRSCLSNS